LIFENCIVSFNNTNILRGRACAYDLTHFDEKKLKNIVVTIVVIVAFIDMYIKMYQLAKKIFIK